MGTWGPGLWQDDTAADIRGAYREALEDGLTDEDARNKVLNDFSADLADEEYAGVVWLALAGVQHSLGRLDADVRDQALRVIDGGSDLLRWQGSKELAKRRAVLAKLRDDLVGPQPARKKVRRPPRRVTTLVPGEVVAYRARSGRYYLLAVQAIHENRYGSYPCVRLLNYEEEFPPDATVVVRLADRPMGDMAQGSTPAQPWWKVDGVVMHKRGQDYADFGFTPAGRRPPLPLEEQRNLAEQPKSYSGWQFWKDYFDKQNELLTQRLTERSGGLLRRWRRS